MTLFKMGLTLACVAALTACTDYRQNEEPYGNGSGTGGYGTPGVDPDVYGSGSGNGSGAGYGSGGVNDPSSAAYFNQTIGDRVLFPVDQSTLTATAIQTLNAQAKWLQQYPNYSATIEGHADEQGTREYNLALGARRASAVRDHLVSRGISANRIDIVTYGKERPIEICSTESCWAKNRRAVTLVAAGLNS